MAERVQVARETTDQMNDPLRNETILAEGVTFGEFLRQYSEMHAEWVNGKVILVVANNTRHQLLLSFIEGLFKLFMAFKGGIGKVLLAGVPMYVHEDRPAREPDLLIVLNEHSERIKETYLDGPADIAVEIVSPESTERDRGIKFREYQAGGVPEYWLIDPIHTDASVYALDETGRYHPVPRDAQGRLVSRVLPGFALDPALLWREELPNAAEEIKLVQQMLG